MLWRFPLYDIISTSLENLLKEGNTYNCYLFEYFHVVFHNVLENNRYIHNFQNFLTLYTNFVGTNEDVIRFVLNFTSVICLSEKSLYYLKNKNISSVKSTSEFVGNIRCKVIPFIQSLSNAYLKSFVLHLRMYEIIMFSVDKRFLLPFYQLTVECLKYLSVFEKGQSDMIVRYIHLFLLKGSVDNPLNDILEEIFDIFNDRIRTYDYSLFVESFPNNKIDESSYFTSLLKNKNFWNGKLYFFSLLSGSICHPEVLDVRNWEKMKIYIINVYKQLWIELKRNFDSNFLIIFFLFIRDICGIYPQHSNLFLENNYVKDCLEMSIEINNLKRDHIEKRRILGPFFISLLTVLKNGTV
jgi:hypothetical protein